MSPTYGIKKVKKEKKEKEKNCELIQLESKTQSKGNLMPSALSQLLGFIDFTASYMR